MARQSSRGRSLVSLGQARQCLEGKAGKYNEGKMKNPRTIFNNEAELRSAQRQWNDEFNLLMKTKGKGKKFESVTIRSGNTYRQGRWGVGRNSRAK